MSCKNNEVARCNRRDLALAVLRGHPAADGRGGPASFRRSSQSCIVDRLETANIAATPTLCLTSPRTVEARSDNWSADDQSAALSLRVGSC